MSDGGKIKSGSCTMQNAGHHVLPWRNHGVRSTLGTNLSDFQTSHRRSLLPISEKLPWHPWAHEGECTGSSIMPRRPMYRSSLFQGIGSHHHCPWGGVFLDHPGRKKKSKPLALRSCSRSEKQGPHHTPASAAPGRRGQGKPTDAVISSTAGCSEKAHQLNST